MKANWKKVWSVTWKTLTSVVLLFCVMVGGIMLNEYFHSWEFRHRYGSESREMFRALNSSAYKIEYKWGKYYRTVDAVTGEKLTPKLNYIYQDRVTDTLTVFEAMGGKRGYLNAYTGKIAIEAQYEHAWIFSEGLGAVVKDGMLGFIDHQGNWAIEPRFRYAGEVMEYVFHNGLCTVKDSCGLFGIIDRQGRYVVEPIYTRVRCANSTSRVLEKEGMCGLFVDSVKQMVLDCEYDWIALSDKGVTLTRDGRMWMVAHDLKTVLYSNMFDRQGTFTIYLDEESEENEYGEYDERKHYEYDAMGYYVVMGRKGLLDRSTGRMVTPAVYEDIEYVSPNLFDCTLSGVNDQEHVFINAKGEMVG